MIKSKVHRTTLPNGLRVILEHRPESPRTAICVHYGVGYRSERPGQEGFAHLFEHLMFRGSASLPPGSFYEHIHPLGGQANGTTHQDYTDYHQLVPSAAVDRALFSEADRMRAPVFTEATLAEQRDGIEGEIHQAVTARPYGGLPWPLLPGVVFDRFANAHDGYGRLEQLRNATLEACETFFHTHYAPGNAVLTVVGDHHPDTLLPLIERHFGDIPARPSAPPPDLHEPALLEDRWQTCTEPAVTAAALALGYRLPDPREDMTRYLAHVVLADMITHHGLDGLQTVSAGCGVFGPLDAQSPDLLVITGLVPSMVPPEQAVGTVTDSWSPWAAAPHFEQAQSQAVRRLITRHHREHADAYARARALGRLELLFDRADLLDAYPALLAGIGPEEVAQAARGLGTAPKGVLVMAPGPTRTRPDPVRGTAAEAVPDPTPSARPPAAARPVPPLGVRPAPYHGARRETTLPGGTRVVAVRDARSPLVELRWRLPLGPSGWRDPEGADALVRLLAARYRVASRAEHAGGSCQLTTDGEWFDVSGYTTADQVGAWLTLLGGLATPLDTATSPPRTPPTSRRPHAPEALMDTALRRHWLAETLPATHSATPCDLGAMHQEILRHGGWLIAVGDLDPERFTAEAERTLAPGPSGHTAPHTASPPPTGGLLAVHHDVPDAVRLTLSAPEPADDRPTGAARYLATALFGAHHGSRLVTSALGAGLTPSLHAGRDICLGLPRAYVRATLPRRDAARGVAGIQEALRSLPDTPATAAELEPIRAFCAAQLLSAFDSPAAKADLLRDGVSAGRPVHWAERLPDDLRQTTAAEVGAAGAALFRADAMTVIALGEPGAVSEATGRWAGYAGATTPG
ncbi:insulinase family protein [Streptomyces sp. NPDC001700]